SSESRRPFLISQRERIRKDLDRFARIVRNLETNNLTYTADDVIDEFCRYLREYSLFSYMRRLIDRLLLKGKIRTSETYRSALNSFMKFRDGDDIMLDCISTDIMEAYEAWLKKRGNSYNTISFYNRILRAVYNRAVNEGIIEDATPFRHVYTGIAKTVKRALPLKTISRIKSLELTGNPALEFARDIFILSFMLRGMSFIDMAFLKKSDLKGSHITYHRRKTGQRLVIEWTREMQAILNRYPANPTPYLLPIIRNPDVNELCSYRNAAYTINRNLKKIAARVGLAIPLTLYVARHSWASAAKTKGIPLSVISEGMGHDNEATTRIYLASLETSVVDKANAIILKSL
ncbi:MAG: site-specific integrase, partial [Muribaculaceae bacterium]|nr:site-specific integrase [Muribaculaceae bacterium]